MRSPCNLTFLKCLDLGAMGGQLSMVRFDRMFLPRIHPGSAGIFVFRNGPSKHENEKN